MKLRYLNEFVKKLDKTDSIIYSDADEKMYLPCKDITKINVCGHMIDKIHSTCSHVRRMFGGATRKHILTKVYSGSSYIHFDNSHFASLRHRSIPCEFSGSISHNSLSNVQWSLAHKKLSIYKHINDNRQHIYRQMLSTNISEIIKFSKENSKCCPEFRQKAPTKYLSNS